MRCFTARSGRDAEVTSFPINISHVCDNDFIEMLVISIKLFAHVA